MNILRYGNKQQKHIPATVLLAFYILTMALNSFSAPPPPSINQCKSKWTLTNITSGMQFGDFTIGSGTGSIILNGGTARTNTGTVNFVAAGSAVNSHQISITNTKDPVICATYGITIAWNIDPTTTPMVGAGANITMSNILVDIPGEAGTPFTVANLPYSFIPASLPIVLEITSQMNASFPQVNGAYISTAYDIGVIQGAANTSGTGIADTFSITPLTLTPGVNMNFGLVSTGSAGGTILLNEASGVRSVGSGDADVVNGAVVGIPGTFTIQGNIGLTFGVSYTNGSLTNSVGGNAMAISGFTDTTGSLILTGGVDSFSVGATLNLNASQPAGNYSTANPGGVPYSITVNYN